MRRLFGKTASLYARFGKSGVLFLAGVLLLVIGAILQTWTLSEFVADAGAGLVYLGGVIMIGFTSLTILDHPYIFRVLDDVEHSEKGSTE